MCNDIKVKMPDLWSIIQFNFYKLQFHMGNLLYVIAVILVISWAIGYLGYNSGGIIHILLVIAVIAVILRIIQGRKVL